VKRYDGAAALGPIDLTVTAGRPTALIGPSGAGKSTLLRMLNGLVWPDSGQVRFRGRPLPRDELPGIRRQIGYVVQGGGLFPHLAARENVAVVARWLRWDEGRIAARLEELAAIARLPFDAPRRLPRQLSRGQAQRVSPMPGPLLHPDVPLLHEALGAPD